MELGDGDSFAIGGLLNESDLETLTKVPFIGDIPILGH
ncbi:type II and III secretion system protein [Budvicia aquatica]|nr:type II and III secretion system protein [Budvicia aquatica]